MCAESIEEITYYVSSDGKYANAGDRGNPMNIEGARDAIRNNKKDGIKRSYKVIFTEGEYRLSSTVEFTEADDGYSDFPITYRAEDGANVIITGTKEVDISLFKTVTDNTILDRVNYAAKDKLLQLDLSEFDGVTQALFDIGAGRSNGVGTTSKFYLNGKKQPLSRYPNFGYLTIGYVSVDGKTFSSQDILDRWKTANHAYVDGYLGTDWCREWDVVKSIDTQNSTISLEGKSVYSPKEGYRWSIINLLEEIDMPGEWYVDIDSMMLYYYPMKELNSTDSFEIAMLDDSFFRLTGTKHIIFDGLQFDGNACKVEKKSLYSSNFGGSGNGIELKNNVNSVKIRNCIFSNIGDNAILIDGINVEVRNCAIYDIGGCGIVIRKGGDRNGLSSSNNLIVDNHIYRVALDTGTNGTTGVMVWHETYGAIVENNIIHNIPIQGIRFAGNENIIRNNEVYNVGRHSQDAGAIYTGRNFSEYGNVIEHNYLHHIGSDVLSNTSPRVGVFLDDFHSGTTVKNNIIKFNDSRLLTFGVLSGSGKDNEITGNVILGASVAVRLSSYLTKEQCLNASGTINSVGGFKTAYNTLANYSNVFSEAFKNKYPKMINLYNDIIYNNIYFPDGIIVKNNTYVECSKGDASNSETTINYRTVFNGDGVSYNVREGNIYESGKSEEDFNLEGIGFARFFEKPNATFRLLNSKKLFYLNDNMELYWENALYADEYEYFISTDRNFNTIIESGITDETGINISGMEEGHYYYKVIARNLSRQLNNMWQTENIGEFYVVPVSNADVIRCSPTNNILVYGQIISKKEDELVTILLINENEKIGYIGEAITTSNGMYSFRFHFSGDISQYKWMIGEQGLPPTEQEVTVVDSTQVMEIFLTDSSGNAYFDDSDTTLNAEVRIHPQFEDGTECFVVFAFYNSDNKMIDCKIIKGRIKDNIYSTVIDKTDTAKIKAFLWESINGMQVLSKPSFVEKATLK